VRRPLVYATMLGVGVALSTVVSLAATSVSAGGHLPPLDCTDIGVGVPGHSVFVHICPPTADA
jgi:hypothetical protein